MEDQRSHFQSDWHRLNVRRRLASKPALSEEDFERLVQQQEEVECFACLGCRLHSSMLPFHVLQSCRSQAFLDPIRAVTRTQCSKSGDSNITKPLLGSAAFAVQVLA